MIRNETIYEYQRNSLEKAMYRLRSAVEMLNPTGIKPLTPLQKLSEVVSSKPIMCYIASECDRRYNEVMGTEYFNPKNFSPPFDEKKGHIISANTQAVFAVIAAVQLHVFNKGARTREEINAGIIPELEEVLAIRDYRSEIPKSVLELLPLNIEHALHLFGDKISYLLGANATWNGFQWARRDRGPLGAATRSNIFSELSLGELMLDWDQVQVVARILKDLLTGSDEDFFKKTHEILLMDLPEVPPAEAPIETPKK